jgi:hypothetical protein
MGYGVSAQKNEANTRTAFPSSQWTALVVLLICFFFYVHSKINALKTQIYLLLSITLPLSSFHHSSFIFFASLFFYLLCFTLPLAQEKALYHFFPPFFYSIFSSFLSFLRIFLRIFLGIFLLIFFRIFNLNFKPN